MSRLIDADALFAVVKGHHDLYNGATNPTDKARRDENLQVMCDITDAPDIDAIPVEWLKKRRDIYLKSYHAGHESEIHTAAILNDTLMAWRKEQEART